MIFENFPYTNFHDINLDWILKTFREMEKQLDEFVFMNTIKYADPIQWNITSQYAKNTIVIDPATGDAYISVQAVPSGVLLSDTAYWSVIFNYQAVINTIKENIAYDAGSSPTTPIALQENDLVWWNDDIYRVLYDIPAGTAFISGTNVERYTVDQKFDLFADAIRNLEAEDVILHDADTLLQDNIDDEEQARIDADTTLQENIDAEAQARIDADEALEEELQGAIESVVSVETVPDKFVRMKLHRFADSDIYHFSFMPSDVEVVAPNGNTAAPRPNTVPLLKWAAENNPDLVINGGFREATYFNGTYWYDPDDTSSYATVFLALEHDSIEWCALADGIETLHRQGYNNIVASIDPVITNGQAFDHTIYNDAEHQAFYNETATRLAITVDNGYWEVFVIAGRTPFNKGMTFAEQERFFIALGYQNVYSLDGGDSVGVCAGTIPMIPIQDWTDTAYGRDNLVNFIEFTI